MVKDETTEEIVLQDIYLKQNVETAAQWIFSEYNE